MAAATSHNRRNPAIGPLAIASMLLATVAVFLVWCLVAPFLPESIKVAVKATFLIAYCVFFAIDIAVVFNVWRKG